MLKVKHINGELILKFYPNEADIILSKLILNDGLRGNKTEWNKQKKQ